MTGTLLGLHTNTWTHVKSRKINSNHMPEPRHLRKHSSSTLSSHQMSHHPPHPLFLSQVTLQMKLTLIACIVISLFWSLPKDNDPRWGLERWLTSKSKGLPLCSDCPDVWRFVSLSLSSSLLHENYTWNTWNIVTQLFLLLSATQWMSFGRHCLKMWDVSMMAGFFNFWCGWTS